MEAACQRVAMEMLLSEIEEGGNEEVRGGGCGRVIPDDEDVEGRGRAEDVS